MDYAPVRDRFRGIKGTRKVLLLNSADMRRLGIQEGPQVTAVTARAQTSRRKMISIAEPGSDSAGV